MSLRSKIIQEVKEKNKEKILIVDNLLHIVDGVVCEKSHHTFSPINKILVSENGQPLFKKDGELYEATSAIIFPDLLLKVSKYEKYTGVQYERTVYGLLPKEEVNIDVSNLP